MILNFVELYLVNRHIKKKFLNQDKTPVLKSGSDIQVVDFNIDNQKLYATLPKNKIVGLTKKQNKDSIFAFIHKNKKSVYYAVPLPDFTLCYFNFAYFMFKELNDSLCKLDVELSTQFLEIDCEEELYRFYGYSSSFIIHLFTSLESFVNSMIPYHQSIMYKNTRIDRQDVIERKGTNDKIKYVLSSYYGKNYFSRRTKYTQAIYDMKSLRDDIVHMKYDSTLEKSVTLFRKLLNFQYYDSLNAVADLMNFYKPGYVEPCDCTKDF